LSRAFSKASKTEFLEKKVVALAERVIFTDLKEEGFTKKS